MPRVRSCAIDGNVEGALVGERLPVEVCVTRFEGEACELRHEIELGGKRVARLRLYEPDSLLRDAHLRCVESLRDRVVSRGIKAYEVRAELSHTDGLPGFDARGIGNERANHEAPVRREVRSDVAEASHLVFLAG